MEVVCRPTIEQPADLKNHVVGVWFGGLESAFYAWISGLALNPFGGPGSVTVLRQNYGLEAFQRLQSDCATTFSYAAPLEFAAADISLRELKQYRYQEIGQATLEDGLYAREEDLAKPDRVAAFAGFLDAARRGWQAAPFESLMRGAQAPPSRGGEQAPPSRGGEQSPPSRGGEQAPPSRGGEQCSPNIRSTPRQTTTPARSGRRNPRL